MKKRNIKKIVGIAVITFVVIGILVYMEYSNQSKDKVTTYQVSLSSVQIAESIESKITLNGTLKLKSESVNAVSIEYNSNITQLYVKDGQKVDEGQELFSFKKLSDNSAITIYAERTGIVEFSKEIYVGSIISQYTTVLKIYKLETAADFYIEAKIHASDYENMAHVSTVEVTFGNSITNIVLDGTVEDRVPRVVEENNSEYYVIDIQLQDPDSKILNYKLAEGMSVNLCISTSTQLLADEGDGTGMYYTIPFNSLVLRDNINTIFVCGKSGSVYYARKVVIDLLSCNGANAVVKSDFLSSNARIITEGNYNLNGGETININNDSGIYLNLDLLN